MSKILIVEQDVFFSNVLKQRVQKEGYDALVVNNNGVAIEQMMLYKPDLVLIDIDTPVGSSVSRLKTLAQKSTTPAVRNIPVIMISPKGDLDEVHRAVELGVKDYVVKANLNLDDLVKKIRTHFDKSGPSVGSALAGKKVMWIEDDQFLSDLVARKLSKHGCVLLYARTGEDAIALLEKETPDIILLDFLLPGINGFDVFEHKNKMPHLQNVPVIVLSNFSDQGKIDKAKELGAARFLVKATIVLDDLVREMVAVLAEKGKK
jgi:DNA-binding response OmpR family regulator